MILNVGLGSVIVNNINIVILIVSVKDVYGYLLLDEDVKFILLVFMIGNFMLSSESVCIDVNGDVVVILCGIKVGEFIVMVMLIRNNIVVY